PQCCTGGPGTGPARDNARQVLHTRTGIMTLTRPNKPRNRRRILLAVLAAAAAVITAIAGLLAWRWSTADVNTIGKIRFGHRLAIPPVAPSRRDRAGRRAFDLRAAAGTPPFRPRPATPPPALP